MRLDIMTDIETLGTNADSTIIQVSAIAFNIETGEHFQTFNQIADISINESPINVTGKTLQWWMKTNKELFSELLNSGEFSSEHILRNFQHWIASLQNEVGVDKTYLWGNGILFDNKMIEHQMKSIGLHYPIFYRNDRDVRTLLELASVKNGVSEKELRNHFADDSLVAHNAFDDVVYQIRLAVGCYQDITGIKAIGELRK